MFERSSASAPASIANLNAGFDILGISFPTLKDTIHLEQCHASKGIWIRSIKGADLPDTAHDNTATIPLLQMQKDFKWPFGLAVDIDKQIPVASGLGGSAASAVAAVKAASVWAPTTLSLSQELYYAGLGESLTSGNTPHFDNIAPSLIDGLVLITPHKSPCVRQLPSPKGLSIIVWHPQIKIRTSESRQRLSKEVPLDLYIKQSSFLASSLSDLYEQNFQAWAQQLQDLIIQPQRQDDIPNFASARSAAISEGALCFGISGSGPSCFAICDQHNASSIEYHVRNILKGHIKSWTHHL